MATASGSTSTPQASAPPASAAALNPPGAHPRLGGALEEVLVAARLVDEVHEERAARLEVGHEVADHLEGIDHVLEDLEARDRVVVPGERQIGAQPRLSRFHVREAAEAPAGE